MKINTEEGGEGSLPRLYRLIDANLNRLREGIRVLEDIQRFIYDNGKLAGELKTLRHQCRVEPYEHYLEARDIVGDVLKETTDSEAARSDLHAVQRSNIKRAQESARVLEEGFKLIDSATAEKFKQIRYRLYNIEKEISKRG